ncbi:MAG: aminopeptidase P family protein [Candidatus Handelsmanbacteria bacterium]|nr:aminopeptidase P family protein [Candidatus Handelsmanbacteria bacterium]
MLFNRPRAIEYMRHCGLDALIATSPVNLTYLTGYYCWLDRLFKEYMVRPGGAPELFQNYALFPLSGEPALVVSSLMAVNARGLWVKDVRGYGDPGYDRAVAAGPLEQSLEYFQRYFSRPAPAGAVQALLDVLKERGLAKGRIGVELEGLPAWAAQALREGLPGAEMVDCTNLIRLVRMVKNFEELARLEKAAALAEEAALGVLRQARVGDSLSELTGQFRCRLAAGGAELDHFAYSPRGLGIATEPEYRLAEDDVMYLDFGCVCRNYSSDSGLTLAMRPVNRELARRYAALHQCLEAGVQAMRPGARASQVQRAMQEALGREGYTASYPHGHGLGLEVRDYPVLSPDTGLRVADGCVDEPADLPVEEGMVLNLEAMFFMPGVGSLHLEKSFVVEAGQTRSLVPQDRRQPLVPG